MVTHLLLAPSEGETHSVRGVPRYGKGNAQNVPLMVVMLLTWALALAAAVAEALK